MVKGFLLCLVLVVLAILVGGLMILHRMPINSIQPTSHFEEAVALRAREYLISRDAEQTLPPEPAATADSIEDGHTIYGSLCAGCHGYDGRTPTRLGSSMFPRTPSLAGPAAQDLSDAEIYVSIRGGIRHSGMPTFGNTESSEQIWELVQYIRSLPSPGGKH